MEEWGRYHATVFFFKCRESAGEIGGRGNDRAAAFFFTQ